jgi:hypothetical protein
MASAYDFTTKLVAKVAQHLDPQRLGSRFEVGLQRVRRHAA